MACPELLSKVDSLFLFFINVCIAYQIILLRDDMRSFLLAIVLASCIYVHLLSDMDVFNAFEITFPNLCVHVGIRLI